MSGFAFSVVVSDRCGQITVYFDFGNTELLPIWLKLHVGLYVAVMSVIIQLLS